MLKFMLKSRQNFKLASWQVNELTSVLVCECMGLRVGELGWFTSLLVDKDCRPLRTSRLA